MAITADEILAIAKAEIGTAATAVKRCKYNTWYYGSAVSGSGYDWCEVFVQWVFAKAGGSALLYTKTANCGYGAKAFQDNGRLVTSGYQKGDVVYFHWTSERSTLVPGTYVSDHVGIVESVGDGTLTAIEGNTGGGNGAVKRCVRSLSSVSCAGRPAYASKASSAKTASATPDILYRVRSGGRWLPEVCNLADYAGIRGVAVTDIAVRVSDGSVKYRAHIKGGDWLPYVSGCDISDDENGYAGDGKPIDAVELYYTTPSSLIKSRGALRAKYRVATTGCDYYPWQYDDERTATQDGYAGEFGKTFDRFQAVLAD